MKQTFADEPVLEERLARLAAEDATFAAEPAHPAYAEFDVAEAETASWEVRAPGRTSQHRLEAP